MLKKATTESILNATSIFGVTRFNLNRKSLKQILFKLKEERVYETISKNTHLTIPQIAFKTNSSYGFVYRTFRKWAEHPTSSWTDKPDRFPSPEEIKIFIHQLYYEKGSISLDWGLLCCNLKNRFPYLNKYKNKTLSNRFREHCGIKAINNKRKPKTADVGGYNQRQIFIGSLIARGLLEDPKGIVFFDETIYSSGNHKKTSLGTRNLTPIRYNRPVKSIHALVMFRIDNEVAIQFATTPSNTEVVINFFKEAVPYFMERKQTGHRLVVVLDNVRYQKTKAFKKIAKDLGVDLLYTVPTSPFLNLIEDFFLKVKKNMRRSLIPLHLKNPGITFIKGFRTALTIDAGWIVRKFTKELEKRMSVRENYVEKREIGYLKRATGPVGDDSGKLMIPLRRRVKDK